MRPPIIRFQNSSKRFGPKKIFTNVNLDIYPGEIFGLIGPSGVGKTTLLKTLIGYYMPNTGAVLFRGKGTKTYYSTFHSINNVKHVFGYAAQQPSFYDQLTVYENLDYFASLFNVPANMRKRNIMTLIKLVDLEGAKNALACKLSGGMQRRLDIACSLVHDPPILILDEPTADLDPVLTKQIWGLIKKINKRGTTIVVASHHIADLENLCTRVGILMKEKFMYVGSIRELFKEVSNYQEIHMETFPGNFNKVLDRMNDDCIINKENRGFEMVLFTTKPSVVLHKLLHEINHCNETMIDVKITKPNLNKIFLAYTQMKNEDPQNNP